MKLSEVLGMEVVSASGQHLGRVIDLRSAGEANRGEIETARVIHEVIYGRVGFLERMGMRAIHEQVVPWTEVATVGTRRLRLKS